MIKKIQLTAMSLLAICLFSLFTTQITEAAVTPDEVITALQTRLDTIVANALAKRDTISGNVAEKVTKLNQGDISRNKFCRKMRALTRKANRARTKFNRKLIKVTKKKVRKLERIGAAPSYRTDAETRGATAQTTKDGYYDTLDTEIADAKNEPASPCL